MGSRQDDLSVFQSPLHLALNLVFSRTWELGKEVVISSLRKTESLKDSVICSRSHKTVVLRQGTGSSWISFPRQGSYPVHFCTCPRVLTTMTGPTPCPAPPRCGPCILTCPPRPQVRGHLPGGEGAEPVGVPAQRAHLLPGLPGHPARGAVAGI